MGASRLLEAIESRDVPTALRMIEEEPSTVATSFEAGPGPLLASVFQRLPDVTEALLEAGVQPTLFEAAALGDLTRIRELTTADPGLLAATGPDGWTALHLAAHFGHARATASLLDRGADPLVVAANEQANTPLHAAAAGASAAVAELLLEDGAKVDARDAQANTPLHIAAASGATGVVSVLLTHGCEPSPVNEDGDTPEAVALGRGHERLADMIRAHDA